MHAELTILGNNSASPTKNRNQSGQHFKIGQDQLLFDCGEGTQKRLILNRINYQKISRILISHLHGDHFLGLMGLLNTMALNGRKNKITVISPIGLKEFYKVYSVTSDAHSSFEIEFIELESEKTHQLDTDRLAITAIPVSHRLPCFAYIVKQRNLERKLIIDVCNKFNVPVSFYPEIKLGKDYTNTSGEVISNDILTRDPLKPIAYGYITDTLYRPDLANLFADCHTIYHEATYLHNLIDRAVHTKHSTALQAGTFAQKASVNQLLIGHFSSRYLQMDAHLEESKTQFTETLIAEEGKTFEIY
jgi:ribonuclease Z